MTISESEAYPVGRFRSIVAWLSLLLLALILIGLLSHRTLHDNRPAWKSSPYGEPRDTGGARAGH